jgi:hypothetical protein
MSETTINLHLTFYIERDGDVEYIREAEVKSDGRTNDHAELCDIVRQAVNDELAGQDLPQEDGE